LAASFLVAGGFFLVAVFFLAGAFLLAGALRFATLFFAPPFAAFAFLVPCGLLVRAGMQDLSVLLHDG
jgi:hypothetical protein